MDTFFVIGISILWFLICGWFYDRGYKEGFRDGIEAENKYERTKNL